MYICLNSLGSGARFASCSVSDDISGAARCNAGPVATGLVETKAGRSGERYLPRASQRKAAPGGAVNADRGPDHKEAELLMADCKSTDIGLSDVLNEDDRDQRTVLQQVLYLHPTSLMQVELGRELTGAGLLSVPDNDALDRAVRDLAGTGLLHPPCEGGMVRPTRAALRYFELSGGGF